MNPLLIALACLVGGYLIGAVSSARVVARIVNPEVDITKAAMVNPADGQAYETPTVNATSVSLMLGSRYGMVAALLDILKVFIPTLLVRLLLKEQPYHLLVALGGVIGNDWPVYYRFRGGTGISALLGGFLAAAPLLTLASMLVAGIIGMALQSGMVAMFGGLLLLIPVLAVAKHDWRYPACLAVCFVLMLVAMSPAAKSMKGAEGASFRSVMRMETVPMGKQFIAMSEKLGFGRKKGQGSS